MHNIFLGVTGVSMPARTLTAQQLQFLRQQAQQKIQQGKTVSATSSTDHIKRVQVSFNTLIY